MKRFWLLFLVTLPCLLNAQTKMKVIRGTAVDRATPIQNVHVDENNKKLVGNSKGLFLVHARDFSDPMPLAAEEQSLISIPGGNEDIKWKTSGLQKIIGDLKSISAAFYDKKRDELWIGTTNAGLYKLKTKPRLQLLQQLDNSNSKLKSNHINAIFVDNAGQKWIGSQEGVMVGNGNKWSLKEKLFSIEAITARGKNTWLMGEGLLWHVDEYGIWLPVDIEARLVEGIVKDVELDKKGNLWIASEIITQYETSSGLFRIYGPAQEFTSQNVTCIAIDKDDAVWVGTEDKGLFLIEEESALTITCILEKPLSCTSAGGASIKVRIVGGEAPFSYAWSSNLSGDNPQNLKAGAYTVTVTDKKGRSKSSKLVVEKPGFEVDVIQEKEESAKGGGDAIASVSVLGGVGPFLYRWDNGETTKTAKNLTAGRYRVSVTDRANCRATGSIEITKELEKLTVSLTQITANNCHGDLKAAIDVEVIGGKKPYVYEWNREDIEGKLPAGLSAGEYKLTVTDALESTANATISLVDPPAIFATVEEESPASTGNADGSAIALVSGGKPNYQYAWDNGETGQTASKLSPGLHKITVTDASGCTLESSVKIEENILPLSVSLNQTDKIKCPGESTAALEVSIDGGKGPFKYTWNKSSLTGKEISNLPAGEYSVSVSDVTGKNGKAKFTVREPAALTANISIDSPASTNNSDGKASVSIKGGSAPFSYKWDNGETTSKATKLGPGAHSITVTDASGCSATNSTNIKENILAISASIKQIVSVTCNGSQTGAIEVSVNGGKPPFQYQWSGAGMNGTTPAKLAAGNYRVTITDAAGNTASAKYEIDEPAAVSAYITIDAPASTGNSDGKATVSVKGGIAPYKYKWSNGETNQKATKLGPGTHTVTVTDVNGCSSSASSSVKENILALSASIDQLVSVKCYGSKTAALQATANGGKPPFQYQWSGADMNGETPAKLAAGLYRLTLTDAVGNTATAKFTINEPDDLTANIIVEAPASTGNSDGKAKIIAKGGTAPYKYKWSNGGSNATVSNLAPTTHSVTVSDAAGCSSTATVDINENILPLTVSISQTKEIKCAGEKSASLQVEVNGGKPPFNYSWQETGINGDKPSGLGIGTFSVTVTDVAGQTKSNKFEIRGPEALSASTKVNAPATTDNADGKATAIPKGGTPPFSYKWSNGETEERAIKLGPGKHQITITDAGSCTATAFVEITENVLPLSASISQVAKINCAGEKSGAVSVEVSGGKGPFKYQWNQAALSGNNPTNLVAGDYALTVTDAKGGTTTSKINIPEPATLSANIIVQGAASTNESNGKAMATVKGGTRDYNYRWDTGETSEIATQLGAGTHGLTVTDAAGCSATASVEITENILPLSVSITQTSEVNCYREKTAALEATVNGGKPPYTYQWNEASLKGKQASRVGAGKYELTVKDVSGKSKTASIEVREPAELSAKIISKNAASEIDSEDGRAKVLAEGGRGPYEYAWDTGEKDEVAKKLGIGFHNVTIIDSKGCEAMTKFEIKKKIIPELQPNALRIGQTIRLKELYFTADSASLTGNSTAVLEELFFFLDQNPTISVEIGGHTNGVPPHEYCDNLSTARAKTISAFLATRGIPADRIPYRGYGKRNPIASNRTPDGRKRNQRVEIKILSL